MSYRIYLPGERKGNVFCVARIWFYGQEREFVCYHEGRPTTDPRLAKRFAKSALAKALREGRPAPVRQGIPQTFAEAAERYIIAKNINGPNEKRVRALADDPIFGALALEAIVQDDIYAAAHRIRRGRRRKSVVLNASKNRDTITPSAAVLHYAADNQWRSWLRIKKLKVPSAENRRPVAGTGESLLSNSNGLKRLLILLWFRQGWRIGESLTLRADKIRLAEREFDLWIPKVAQWKTMEMHDDVFFALANLDPPLPKEGPVFPWTRWQVYSWLGRLCKGLGIRFTPHMARHEFGSAIRDGRALVEVGTWTSEASTSRYVHGDKEFKRDILRKVK